MAFGPEADRRAGFAPSVTPQERAARHLPRPPRDKGGAKISRSSLASEAQRGRWIAPSCARRRGRRNLPRAWLAIATALAATAARAQTAVADPAGSGVILSAVTWLQGTLLGNVATALAVIAVGATGLMMLTGRLDWRRGATVILGCFIVFGAAAIVAGIRSVASGAG